MLDFIKKICYNKFIMRIMSHEGTRDCRVIHAETDTEEPIYG